MSVGLKIPQLHFIPMQVGTIPSIQEATIPTVPKIRGFPADVETLSLLFLVGFNNV